MAIHFAVLDQNPEWTGDPYDWKGPAFTSTSDITELFAWPIDPVDGRVTPTKGLIVETTFGGPRIGDRGFIIRGPLDLHVPKPARPDAERLDGFYRVFAGEFDRVDAALARRMALATSWLAKAWRNSPTLTWEDRLVFLKTAFEALTGESTATAGATALRKVFEQLKSAGVKRIDLEPGLGWPGLLWRPGETERIRTYQGRQGTYEKTHTPLQHWFMTLAHARNEVIHLGASSSLEYSGRNTYRGAYFFTASRVLREAMKVKLGTFGFGDLWKSEFTRNVERRLRRQGFNA